VTFAAAVAAIRSRMETEWPALRPTIPIRFVNEDAVLADSPTAHVFFEVVPGQAVLRGVGEPGNRLYIYPGIIQAHVFVPTGEGETLARQYADEIGEIFRAKQFGSTVRTNVPSVDPGDSSGDGNYWRVTASIDFDYYHQG